jgi:hypothetical protein
MERRKWVQRPIPVRTASGGRVTDKQKSNKNGVLVLPLPTAAQSFSKIKRDDGRGSSGELVREIIIQLMKAMAGRPFRNWTFRTSKVLKVGTRKCSKNI